MEIYSASGHFNIYARVKNPIFSFNRSLSLSGDYLGFVKNLKKTELWKIDFFNFSGLASSNAVIIVAVRCPQKSILEVEFN